MLASQLTGQRVAAGRPCRPVLASRVKRRSGVVKCVATPARPPSRDGERTSQFQRLDEDNCKVFFDRDGELIRVMPCDYGFRSGAGRIYQDGYGEVPENVLAMAVINFKHELGALRRSFRNDEYETWDAPDNFLLKVTGAASRQVVRGLSALDHWLEKRQVLPKLEPLDVPHEVRDEHGHLTGECAEVRYKLRQLKLNDNDVWEREKARKARLGDVSAPWYIRAPFWLLCIILDVFFTGRPIQRFWVLETVARIPYFAYISILHLYESLGFWRAGADLRRIHFAEEWNELHHLQIMEALGGDQMWFDRFMANHAALVYYWVLIGMYMFSPKNAYAFSELVEWHATDTYEQFVESNKELLASLPPPMVAAAYYRNQDLYIFDELQTCSGPDVPLRRPPCDTLLDVFNNIRDDEVEHVKTMHACQDSHRIAQDLADKRKKFAAEGLSKNM